MNKYTPAIRESLSSVVNGIPIPFEQLGTVMKNIQNFIASSNAHDAALLGNFALKLLLDRAMNDARAERESRTLVDKLREV